MKCNCGGQIWPVCEDCQGGEWRRMNVDSPKKDSEILFVAKEGLTEERIGKAIISSRIVFLRRTDISFDQILWWMNIPESPEEGK